MYIFATVVGHAPAKWTLWGTPFQRKAKEDKRLIDLSLSRPACS